MPTILNLDQDITRLRPAIDTALPSAPMRTGFVAALLADLDAEITDTELTAEERALADVTVERLTIEAQLDDYMAKAFGAYLMATGDQTKLDWLKHGGKSDVVAYAAFFAELPNQADVLARMEQDGHPTLAQLQALYTRQQELALAENLKGSAATKTRKRWDIRILLISLLRYLGVSGSQIASTLAGA